ncbi:prepilin peptidase [Bacillus sp. FJAT-27251]|uniref:A24 family peptidase n=1 Tax=Bacillus sp. FJAT-27251 TaxID=1684142 RepID=UPI0006A7EB65|nr:prepilin peptidase [Bacillus sp. FJAT-27251]
MLILSILITVLLVSLITDVKKRKILNIVTIPSTLIGITYYSITLGLSGFLFSGQGFLVGLSLLLIPYLLGGMGAGDIKLMAAIGALMGTTFVFYSFLYTALIGGVIAILLLFKQKGFSNSVRSLFFHIFFYKSSIGSLLHLGKVERPRISFPYGVAIVLGTFCTLIWGGF